MINPAWFAIAVLAGLPEGDSKIAVDVGSVVLDVYTYRPAEYKQGPLIVSLHGGTRDADVYRDNAKPLADRLGALVVAPLFDEKRFPVPLYQNGGVIKSGKAVPPEERTFALVDRIVAHVREIERRPDMPCYFIGHSAGGQFVVRMAAFHTPPAVRLIAANPGSQLFPTTDLSFPYGFGALPEQLRDEAALRRYLAAPLTLLLGSADTKRDKYLDTSRNADKQGANRWERNHRAFQAARELAAQRGWTFNWKLIVLEGADHDGTHMFGHPDAIRAFTVEPPPVAPPPP